MFLETVVSRKFSVSRELSDHLLHNSILNSHNPKGVRVIARLRLVLCHFQEIKFRHSSQDLLHKICNGGIHVESTLCYLFQCFTRIILEDMLSTA